MATHGEGDHGRYLCVRGKPILTMAEFDSYVRGVPEDAVPPSTLTRWAFGGSVEPGELLRCLQDDATAAAGDSDEALEAVRAALERLEGHFPELKGQQ